MGGGFHLYRAHVCVEYGAEALCATFYFEEILWRRHMKLVIYKGFDKNFLSQLEATPLVNTSIDDKKDVLKFDKQTRKKLEMGLLMEPASEVWITYEEYSLIRNRVEDAIKEDELQVTIYKNNLYPECYPLEFTVSQEMALEIPRVLNGDTLDVPTDDVSKYLVVYNSIVEVDGTFYGSFYNFEFDSEQAIHVLDYYPADIHIGQLASKTDFDLFINNDVDTYLRDLQRMERDGYHKIGVKAIEGEVSARILHSFLAYCLYNNIQPVEYHETLEQDNEQEAELISIAKNDIGIPNFQSFREIPFYENPDINKNVVKISQGKIIREIINQAEKAFDDEHGNKFRDIFITASTGAGKSVMFQVPAVYLAKKYHKLTIIIEPVKALMQDQKEKLQKNGYNRVEAFNSDLITQVEKEAVLERIKNGEVDLLYLSPETLLSYSIETIIGDREIGLLIVDEAHIVTTWGVGFRPDYWYLGGYINRLRNERHYGKKQSTKLFHFPICAFTATAINGGIDDSVSDTIISLYMENPIKYIGYVKRNNIEFDITLKEESKLPKEEYEMRKARDLKDRVNGWLANKEKTIVYFPYASYAGDAKRGVRSFSGCDFGSKVGIYTGRNLEELSQEVFNATKHETFDKFRNGTTSVMFATKAFGMGVDVDDIKNVYHYAVTGNLSDYVQEIGRAARKKGMTGHAVTDYYYNDLSFMNTLFGMSQIKQYQIKRVLAGVYETFKNKKENRSFLISPESFTYIFTGKDESAKINKLKTCLLMIEKDFAETYSFKVLISRPQSVFTKAFVVIDKEYEDKVLNSKYGGCFKFITKGRYQEKQADGCIISDMGDIYLIDLKTIWENFHSNISFPAFKYWYFNNYSTSKDKVEIMPGIREHLGPRQKVIVEARNELLLCEVRDGILDDFEYIGNKLYETYGKNFFTLDEFAKTIAPRFESKGGLAQARIIATALFGLVDPDCHCVKRRMNSRTGKWEYQLSNGNFKEYMRRTIIKSRLIRNFQNEKTSSYSGYMSLDANSQSSIALKLLSIFNYITYEVIGGQEPEIYIRLNDPNKVRNIVYGNTYYSNKYVTKAKKKHDRDVAILLKFFKDLKTSSERWNFIEDYFLGYDVLQEEKGINASEGNITALSRMIDRGHSFQTTQFKKWADIVTPSFFEGTDLADAERIARSGVPIPDYLSVELKKSELGDLILFCWSDKNTLVCAQDTDDSAMNAFIKFGWHPFRIHELDVNELKEALT